MNLIVLRFDLRGTERSSKVVTGFHEGININLETKVVIDFTEA